MQPTINIHQLSNAWGQVGGQLQEGRATSRLVHKTSFEKRGEKKYRGILVELVLIASIFVLFYLRRLRGQNE